MIDVMILKLINKRDGYVNDYKKKIGNVIYIGNDRVCIFDKGV